MTNSVRLKYSGYAVADMRLSTLIFVCFDIIFSFTASLYLIGLAGFFGQVIKYGSYCKNFDYLIPYEIPLLFLTSAFLGFKMGVLIRFFKGLFN